MFNLLRNVKYLTEKKVRNPFFATYLFVLLYRNWALVFTLFNFDDDCSLDDKLFLINSHFEDQNFILEIWTNLWITAVVIIVSYLLFFGFRALANLFERKVFPIADKIDDNLLVTKDRHLKVKEDRDNLNKEFEYVRDENIKLDKNYADIKKELADFDEQFTVNQKELDELKGEKTDLEVKYADENRDKIKLSKQVKKLTNERQFLIYNIENEAKLTLTILELEDKIDLFINECTTNFKRTSPEDRSFFGMNNLIEAPTLNSVTKLTMKGEVLKYYSTQKIKKGTNKLSLNEIIQKIVNKGYLDPSY